jgi:hypothetical protein
MLEGAQWFMIAVIAVLCGLLFYSHLAALKQLDLLTKRNPADLINTASDALVTARQAATLARATETKLKDDNRQIFAASGELWKKHEEHFLDFEKKLIELKVEQEQQFKTVEYEIQPEHLRQMVAEEVQLNDEHFHAIVLEEIKKYDDKCRQIVQDKLSHTAKILPHKTKEFRPIPPNPAIEHEIDEPAGELPED